MSISRHIFLSFLLQQFAPFSSCSRRYGRVANMMYMCIHSVHISLDSYANIIWTSERRTEMWLTTMKRVHKQIHTIYFHAVVVLFLSFFFVVKCGFLCRYRRHCIVYTIRVSICRANNFIQLFLGFVGANKVKMLTPIDFWGNSPDKSKNVYVLDRLAIQMWQIAQHWLVRIISVDGNKYFIDSPPPKTGSVGIFEYWSRSQLTTKSKVFICSISWEMNDS